MLQDQAIRISMDGRGAWRDNVFVERLWRSVKYEEVYLRAYESVRDARASLGRYLDFDNGRRPHSSLGARTPEHVPRQSGPLFSDNQRHIHQLHRLSAQAAVKPEAAVGGGLEGQALRRLGQRGQSEADATTSIIATFCSGIPDCRAPPGSDCRATGAGLSRPSAAVDGSMTTPPAPWPCSGRATPSLREATAPARRAYQPAGKPPIGTETL